MRVTQGSLRVPPEIAGRVCRLQNQPSFRRLRSAGRGFTLIEVLVVVAIIALLISILLPALARTRAQARAAVCSTHLRQFGVGANVFAAEFASRVPRGISRHGAPDASGPINWVRIVARMLGDKKDYRANFNRVPVEKYQVYSCPERAQEYNTIFLDYVINSMDHRGPITLAACRPDPVNGQWYEAEGVTKLKIWPFPSETIYIMDAVEETWNVVEANNSWGTLQNLRQHISEIRAPAPPQATGFDWFDVPGAQSVPMYQASVSTSRMPRAALKMHLNRGSEALCVDGHVELVKPPPESAGAQAVCEFYLRRFGVNRKIIKGLTVLTATAALDPCTSGDTDWRP